MQSAAKGSLGRLADEALKGLPTVIPRGGKLVILRAYQPPDPDPVDDFVQAGKDGPQRLLTPKALTRIWQRDHRLAHGPR